MMTLFDKNSILTRYEHAINMIKVNKTINNHSHLLRFSMPPHQNQTLPFN